MTTQEWYRNDVDFVLDELETSPKGLTTTEADKRLEKYGYNELTEVGKISPLRMFLEQFTDPMVIILLIAIAISLVVAFAGDHGEGGIIDAIMISVIVVFNAVFGFAQEYRSEKALEALKKLAAPKARVLRNDLWVEIDSRYVVPGDIIGLDPGDIVPADGRINQAVGLSVDESILTGESVAVRKICEPLDLENPTVGDMRNTVFQGTTIAAGKGTAVVTETGMNTQFGEIAGLVQESQKEMTPLQHDLADLGKKLGLLITFLCVIIFAAEVYQDITESIIEALFAAIALAVSAVPEGLPAVVTITLAIGVQRMVEKNAIVRRLPSVETLGSTTVICSDKTGTITRNEMTVQELYVDGSRIRVTGSGYDDEGSFFRDGQEIDPTTDSHLEKLLVIGQLCSNSLLQDDPSGAAKWTIVGDPTEGALLVAAEKGGFRYEETWEKYEEITEISFDSARKRMTSICKDQNGDLAAYTKGAPEIVLALCTHLLDDGEVRPLTDSKRDEILNVNAELASNALRVLAMAYRPLESALPDWDPEMVEQNLIFVGLSAMIDPPRDEVSEAIKICVNAGIRPIMITGDHRLTARAIAIEVGLISGEGTVITGAQIDEMTDDEFFDAVHDVDVFARVAPGHKLRIVNALKEQNQVVAMTGDGVNDAPAVKNANVGVSMGIRGSDVTRESSDIILTDDNFATIVTAVEKGREIYENIRKFVRFLLAANFSEIYLIFTMIMIGLPLPITAIQILWINLATDGFPALALGVDPPEPGLMERGPRKPGSRMMNKGLAAFILIGGFVQFIAGSLLFLGSLLEYGGWIPGITGPMVDWSAAPWDFALTHARTVVFVSIVVYELLFVWNCRTEYAPVWKTNVTNSKALAGTVLLSVVLTLIVLYVPFIAPLFGAVPLSALDWLIIFVSCLPALLIPPHKIFGYFREREEKD